MDLASEAYRFDYIIVGGGTAGLTVADRLSEDVDTKVLIVEAGSNHTNNPLVFTPGLFGLMYGQQEYDWNFVSVPQPGLHHRKIRQARGKQLGGSSALNYMLLTHPSRRSLDTWETLGNEGWNYESLEPYFQKSVTVHSPLQSTTKSVARLAQYDDGNFNNSGPIQASFSEEFDARHSAWIDTFSKLGLAMTAGMSSGRAIGAFQPPATIDPSTRTRSFAATAHYSPEIAKRPNLTLMTETIVKKIVFNSVRDPPEATGVLVLTKGGAEMVLNAREIVMAAGSLMTPQILEVSGVGSKALLSSLGIPVIIDNPWVGENLQDHPIATQSFEVADDIPSSDSLRDPKVLDVLIDQYETNGNGPMAQSSISVAYAPLGDASGTYSTEAKKALFATFEDEIRYPDQLILREILQKTSEPTAEYLLFPGQINTVTANPTSMADYLAPQKPENYLTIATMLNHPFSRGSIHISSADIAVLPSWDPNFNSSALDLEIAARHAQFVERIVSTAPFSKILKKGGARIPHTPAFPLEEAKDVIRRTQISCCHPSGSCSMRPEEKGGVVDTRLRVYGVTGLRIVDASIFPLVPVGNIQSVVYAVAEKAADLIKEDREMKV